MKRSHFTYILLALCTAIVMSACSEVSEEIITTDTTTVTEKQPYPVTVGSLVFNAAPENAASLSPAVTEIITELGFEDKLVGRSVYCTYPKSVADKDTLGSAAKPDVEAIIEKAPQLLISQSPIAKKDITAIENAGTRVLIISAPVSAEELYSLYESIYRVFCGDTVEEEAVMENTFAPLEKAFTENEDMLGSFVCLLSPALDTASNETFKGDFLSHFGENLAADKTELTIEELTELDPKYIIMPSGTDKENLSEEMSAFADRMIILDSDTEALLERPTSRVYLAAEFLKKSVEDMSDSLKASEEAESEANVSEE